MLPPWLDESLGALTGGAGGARGAVLLTGIEGIGKRALAEHAARVYLCTAAPAPRPCGICASCSLAAAGNHPDLQVLGPATEDQPEESSEESVGKKAHQYILIEQVRALLGSLELSSHSGGGRVVIIDPADRLNANAANALLKTLEEPPRDTLFILVTAHEERLPVTVRSRCRRLPVPRPSPAQAAAWLEGQGAHAAVALLGAAGGAPMRALSHASSGRADRWTQLLNGIGSRASGLAEWDTTPAALGELCEMLQLLCVDLLRLRLDAAAMYSGHNSAVIEQAARHIAPENLSDWWVELARTKALVHHPLNGALMRDQLVLGLERLLRAPARAN